MTILTPSPVPDRQERSGAARALSNLAEFVASPGRLLRALGCAGVAALMLTACPGGTGTSDDRETAGGTGSGGSNGSAPGTTQPANADAATQSANASLDHLRRVMDQYHTRFPVYDDVGSAGNHFLTYAKIPDANAPVDINGSWRDRPWSGATAIRCYFKPVEGRTFGGFYFQNGTLTGDQRSPQVNFGEIPNAGINLSGARALTFRARGSKGGERVEFFVAGVGRDPVTGVAEPGKTPDSSPRIPAAGTLTTLTPDWTL